MTDKVREFWINCYLINDKENDVEANIYTSCPKNWPKKPIMDYHVIEYRAYESLREENERLRKTINNMCNECLSTDRDEDDDIDIY